MLRLAIAHESDILRLQAVTLRSRSCQPAIYPFHILAKSRFISQAMTKNTVPRTKKQADLSRAPRKFFTDPNQSQHVIDGPEALRASVDAEEADEQPSQQEEDQATPSLMAEPMSDSALSELSSLNSSSKTDHAVSVGSNIGVRYQPVKESEAYNPEAEIDEEEDENGIQVALSRPPPVDSDYLPLPWKGRLGYVCKQM